MIEISYELIPEDVTVESTEPDEAKNYARELDRLKQKDNPNFKGAFHERKNANKRKGVNKRALKAYKFASNKKRRKK